MGKRRNRKHVNQINDPGISPEERLEALRVVAGQEAFPDWVVESNNHIHTCYSFSPYTPSGAALGARPRPVRMEFAASAIARVRSSRAARRGASHASTSALAGAGIACTVM